MRSLRIVGLLAGLLLIAAPSASAHATIELRGERPVAGTRGTLTMTIPHGCGVDQSTDRLVVRLGSAWGRVRPVAPAGWTVSVARATSGRWTITWRATAGGLPNTALGDFTTAVRWPQAPGIYKTPTFQHCGATLMAWSDPFTTAATADAAYPPVYPVPRIQILPAG